MEQPNQPVKEAHLEAMVEAALGGHELGQWEWVENGWQARCQQCQMTTWIKEQGLRYGLLDDERLYSSGSKERARVMTPAEWMNDFINCSSSNRSFSAR